MPKKDIVLEKDLRDILIKAALVLSEIIETKLYKEGMMEVKSPFNTTLQMAQLVTLLDIREKLDILVRVQ